MPFRSVETSVEHTAFSVQHLENAWRWRVYGGAGVVVGEGLESTQRAAERRALFAFCEAGEPGGAAANGVRRARASRSRRAIF